MDKEKFEKQLQQSTILCKEFSLNYIIDKLPNENLYTIHLNSSQDDLSLAQFDIYPSDNGKIIQEATAIDVINTLWRSKKVPVWINISVSGINNKKTIIKLLCAGRYSSNSGELYYLDNGTEPFGIKSPDLPINYEEGVKFSLHEIKKDKWWSFLAKDRR